MTKEKKDVFTLEGKEYLLEEVSKEAKYLVIQLNDINTQKVEKQTKLAQLVMAEEGFIHQLKVELGKEFEEVDEGAE